MAKGTLRCFHCGTEIEFADRVGIREECPKCRSDVHVCKNCQFYDPKVYNECKEPQAEVVREKERANVCDYFQPGSGAGGSAKTKEDLLKAAEALFKKKS
jgi:hypothetical protein